MCTLAVAFVAPATSAQDAAPQVELVGPLTADDRYLGDIDLRVAPDDSGEGAVDVVRMVDLLEPLLAGDMLERLRAMGAEERFRGFEEVSIDGLVVRYDPSRLGVEVEVPAGSRTRGRFSLSGLPAPRLADYAAPANLVAGVQATGRKAIAYSGEPFGSGLTGRVEGFVTIGGFEGFTLSSALDYRSDGGDAFAQDGITLTHDDFDSAVRYEAGTVLPQPVGLQNVSLLRGIGVARRYQQIRPFQNIRPTGRQGIVIERPSTAEVYVNGVLVTRTPLAPGPYDLDDFPLAQGGNDVRLVVQDSTGATETIDRAVFFSPVILSPGLTDFGGWMGVPDTSLASGKRPLVASGYFLRGIERATLGANAQASSQGAQLGINVVQAFRPGFIAFDLAWGGRFDGAAQGLAVAVDAQFNFSLRSLDDLTFNARMEARARDFYGPVDDAAINPTRIRAAGTASYRLDTATTISAGGSYTRAQTSRRETWSINAGVLRQFGRINASAYVQQEQVDSGRQGTSFRFGISVPLGSSTTATTRADTRSGRAELDVSRFRRNIGPDWAARVTVGRQENQSDIYGQAQYFGQRAFASLTHTTALSRVDAQPNGHVTFFDAATFVGFADGRFGWGREGIDGFALIRTHPSLRGGAGARVEQYGQSVFRDDGLGPVVIPFQRGYSPVRQEFFVDRPPEGYALDDTQQELFPGFRTGYKFTIGSDAYLSIQGVMLAKGGGPLALRIGTLRPTKTGLAPADFFTAEDGSFFAQGLAADTYEIVIDNAVVGRMTIKAADDLLVQMGEVMTDVE